MTESHLQRLEQLKNSADTSLDNDLSRDRRRFIADSLKFFGLAWDMDAITHRRLSEKGGVAVGEIVELYITGTVDDIPGLDPGEKTTEITFADNGRGENIRKMTVGFVVPKTIDYQDVQALKSSEMAEGVYVTQVTDGGLPIRYWITPFGSEPFIIPDTDGGSDAGNYSAIDFTSDDAMEIIRAKEVALIANLRESIATWELIPSKTIRKTDGGLEVVDIAS